MLKYLWKAVEDEVHSCYRHIDIDILCTY